MRKRRFTIGVVLLGCVLAGVGLAHQRGKIPDLRVIRADAARHKVDKRVIEAGNRFAMKIFKEAVKRSPGKNVVMSPPSISMALSMAYNGAAGDTRTGIEKVLEFTGLDADVINSSNSALMTLFTRPDRGISMTVTNSLWLEDPKAVVPAFMKLMTSTYHADIGPLDLNAINDWTKLKTRGVLGRAADRLGPNASAAVVNSIYFKGEWSEKFSEESTRPSEFYLTPHEIVQVAMMHHKGPYMSYESKEFEAVRLSYGTGRVGMYVFLPHRDTSLSTFCRELDAATLDKWIQGFRKHRKFVVSMPRFKVESSELLDDDLQSLGMKAAFNSEQADFSRMSREEVWITQVMHKAVVDVDEEGTIAYAVTIALWRYRSASYSPGIRIDRPFLFLIRDDKTGLILFMGAVSDPRG